MEIKGGEGGAESALFAADLLRMYLHYAESKGWKTELLERNESDLGGYKDVQLAIKSNADRPGAGRLGAPEVRGRRAPRAAGARRPSRRGASTPRRPACSCSPRSTSPKRSRSTRTT